MQYTYISSCSVAIHAVHEALQVVQSGVAQGAEDSLQASNAPWQTRLCQALVRIPAPTRAL